jgi:hypothetical protein
MSDSNRDITELMEHYRETARHLWNTGYRWLEATPDTFLLVEDFEAIAPQLFRTFVLEELRFLRVPAEPVPRTETGDRALTSAFRVVPAGCGMDILINRETPRCGYWDDPVNRVEPGEAELQFFEYFDYDVQGLRDFEYYEVLILRFDRHPHLVGRNALVRVRHSRVLLDETALHAA